LISFHKTNQMLQKNNNKAVVLLSCMELVVPYSITDSYLIIYFWYKDDSYLLRGMLYVAKEFVREFTNTVFAFISQKNNRMHRFVTQLHLVHHFMIQPPHVCYTSPMVVHKQSFIFSYLLSPPVCINRVKSDPWNT
jgi:hypothetical protein